MKRYVALIFCLWTGTVYGQTHLQTVAANMAVDTFAALNQAGDGSGYNAALYVYNSPSSCGFGGDPGVGTIYGFSQKAAYDPVTDTIIFTGSAHNSAGLTCSVAGKTVEYHVGNNTWEDLGPPSWWNQKDTIHAYDSNAFVPIIATHYPLLFNNEYPFNINTKTWGTMTMSNGIMPNSAEQSGEYFPDRNELLLLRYNALGKYRYSNNTWTLIINSFGLPAQPLGALGYRSALLRYDPVHHCMLIFGGANDGGVYSRAMYKYDADGNFTRMSDMPTSFNIFQNQTLAAVDPVSGDLIILASDSPNPGSSPGNLTLWKYNVANDGAGWTQINTTIPNDGWLYESGSVFAAVAVPISRYGVIAFMSASAGGTGKVYLFKHSQPNTFANLCAAAGVVRCFNFDDNSQLGTIGSAAIGQNVGTFHNGQTNCNTSGVDVCPVIDTTTSASGVGSLKFTIASNSWESYSGQWFANFSPTLATQYSADGAQFWVQWRQRFSPEFVSTVYWGNTVGTCTLTLSANSAGTGRTATLSSCGQDSFANMVGHHLYLTSTIGNPDGLATITTVTDSTHATVTINNSFASTTYTAGNWLNDFGLADGWKQASLTTGDTAKVIYTSCTSIDIPMENIGFRGAAQIYNSCNGSFSHGPYYPMNTSGPNDDLGGLADIFFQQTPFNYCSYDRFVGNGAPQGSQLPPTGNCFPYLSNQWVTFKYHVTLGTRTLQPDGTFEWVGSNVEVWAGFEGESTTKIINIGPFNLTQAGFGYQNDSVPGGNGTQTQAFGKIFLLPFDTNKALTQTTATGFTWYDDLIISSNIIADPTANATSVAPPPLAPVAMRAGAGKSLSIGNGKTIRAGAH